METGDWDEEVLDWLARLDDSTCRTVASLLWRCRLAGRAEVAQPPEGTVTEWAIRVADPDSGHTDESMPVASEEVARAAVPAWRRGGWAEVAVVSRQRQPVDRGTGGAVKGRCHPCGEDVEDMGNHLRLIHPEVWESFERWPDGELVMHYPNVETPEDIG